MTSRPEIGAGVENVDMSDETVVVTGSTSGIGRETALALARLGATVVVHGRDEEKGRRVVEEIETDDGEATFLRADFSSIDAVRGFADDIRDEVDAVDVLVNNAGGLFSDGRLTDDGIEYSFAVNHVAPFVLTAELLPLLRDSEGRVVNTSSGAHTRADMEFDRLTSAEDYSAFRTYCQTKLANVMFTRELSRRLGEDGAPVTANCFHPGAVPGSGFPRETPLPFRLAARAISALPAAVQSIVVTTVPEGAETAVYLAASPEVDFSGEYLVDCRRRKPSSEARDSEKARRLWELTEEVSDVDYELSS